MAKNKSDDSSKDSRKKEKIKKEKKTLKKMIKAQDKREEKLDKREKKLKKKEKELRKKEEELFELINKQIEDKNAPIEEAVEQAASENVYDHFPEKEPITSNINTKQVVESLEKSTEAQENKKISKTNRKPADVKQEGKETSQNDKQSTDFTVREGFSLIRKMDNEKKIHDFLKGDERKTMQEAGERRIKQLQG